MGKRFQILSITAIFEVIMLISAAFSYTAYYDIEYYPSGTAPQLDKNMLDVYVPDGAVSDLPVIFFVHGGTWMYGDRSDFAAVGQVMADEENYVTVVISYRLSDSLHPGVVHPDHIEDVAQAFAWTVGNIGGYSGDPDKIFIMGHSAGAHLIGLLATNTSYLSAAGADVSDIKGAISFNMAIYDIPKLYYDCGSFASLGYDMMGFSQVFGPIADSASNWYDASPKYHIGPDLPEFILFISTNDMEQIIGGDFGGFGLLILPGEIQFTYSDMNAIQPTDSFWLAGDHDMGFSNFVFDSLSRGRILTMDFIEGMLGIDSDGRNLPVKPQISVYPNPFNSACRISISGGNLPVDEIAIYDIDGKLIERIPNNISSRGAIIWNPSGFTPSGVYLVKAPCGKNELVQRLVFMK